MSLTTFRLVYMGVLMARVSTADAQTAVNAALTAAGGKMKYAALVETLQATGQGQLVSHLPQLKAQGLIVSSMEFETPESSRAVSFVTLSGGVA